jgi:hypothetical protein
MSKKNVRVFLPFGIYLFICIGRNMIEILSTNKKKAFCTLFIKNPKDVVDFSIHKKNLVHSSTIKDDF